jgi:Uncharacterised methyltransferase family (DUF6094)
VQANSMDVRCPAESLSLLYLNPPYDLEVGQTNNQRLELVFLEHTYRWLKPGGVLVFVIPQPQLKPCARILSEQFAELSVFRLTEPACVRYKQVAVVGIRRKRQQYLGDSALTFGLLTVIWGCSRVRPDSVLFVVGGQNVAPRRERIGPTRK